MDRVELAQTDGYRGRLAQGVEEHREQVLALARALHAHPETAFEEHRSAEAITEVLAGHGFAVERGVGQLPTAFTATVGSGDLTVGICVEYDALPGIGHACGHHLITGAGVSAALALAPLTEELGVTLRVIGTPAEEHGGGKVLLLERGVFDDLDLAVMVHALPRGHGYNPAGSTTQAVGRWRATFHGAGAHAAAAPHRGVNAADAVVVSQVAIGLLRQQLPGDHRVAAIVTHGGDSTNVIPDKATLDFECRAVRMPEFHALVDKVRACLEGGALATGTTVEVEATEPVYQPLVHDDLLARHWAEGLEVLGYDTTPGGGPQGGSTDMGNVSRVVPSIHPWVSLPHTDAAIHTPAFAAAAVEDPALDAMLDSALVMAMTVAAVAQSPQDIDALRRRKVELATLAAAGQR